jgi:hypothetical protein
LILGMARAHVRVDVHRKIEIGRIDAHTHAHAHAHAHAQSHRVDAAATSSTETICKHHLLLLLLLMLLLLLLLHDLRGIDAHAKVHAEVHIGHIGHRHVVHSHHVQTAEGLHAGHGSHTHPDATDVHAVQGDVADGHAAVDELCGIDADTAHDALLELVIEEVGIEVGLRLLGMGMILLRGRGTLEDVGLGLGRWWLWLWLLRMGLKLVVVLGGGVRVDVRVGVHILLIPRLW